MKQRTADPTLMATFPHQYWSISEKKGYGKMNFPKTLKFINARFCPSWNDNTLQDEASLC